MLYFTLRVLYIPRRRRRGVAQPTNISTPFQLSQDAFLFCELYSGAPKFPTCCHTQMIPRDVGLANSNYTSQFGGIGGDKTILSGQAEDRAHLENV